MASKKNKTFMKEPTEQELQIYLDLVKDIDEPTLDMFANEYFDKVQKEEINISFAKFVIDKIVRPIRPGDTITYNDGDKIGYLYCLIRHEIEGTKYLLFAMIDDQTEEIVPEMVYLFQVIGHDEIGMEIIDVVESSPEAERILDIMEAAEDVQMVGEVKGTTEEEGE